jgi:hypothetical protein
MQDYKVHFIGHDGRFFKAIDLSREDDSAAIAATKPLIDGHDLELWQPTAGSRGSTASHPKHLTRERNRSRSSRRCIARINRETGRSSCIAIEQNLRDHSAID